MPQKLTKQGRVAEPGDVEYSWDQPYEDKTEQLLGEARYTLGKGRQLMDAPHAAGDVAEAKVHAQFPGERHTGLRGATEFMGDFGGVVGGLGIIPTPASGALLGLSGLLSAPDAARKLWSPDEDESRAGGALQAGLAGLSMVPAMR
jgi:hypothetical protein